MNVLVAVMSQALLAASLLCPPSPSPVVDATPASGQMLLPQADGCPKGAAQPVVNRAIFPKSTFRLLPDKRTGLETVALPSGDQLVLRQEGCEYYVLRLRFETSRFRQRATALEPWLENVSQLLSQAAPGLKAPVDLRAGVVALRAYVKKHQQGRGTPPALGEEIEFGSATMPSTLTVERIQPLASHKVAVEISLSIGPL